MRGGTCTELIELSHRSGHVASYCLHLDFGYCWKESIGLGSVLSESRRGKDLLIKISNVLKQVLLV